MEERLREALLAGSKELVSIGATPMLVEGRHLAIRYQDEILLSWLDNDCLVLDKALIRLYERCPYWISFKYDF